MHKEQLRHWYKPRFWHWWWEARASTDTKRFLLLLLCLLVGAGGFVAATRFSAADAADAVSTTVTVRTVKVAVTRPETSFVPAPARQARGSTCS